MGNRKTKAITKWKNTQTQTVREHGTNKRLRKEEIQSTKCIVVRREWKFQRKYSWNRFMKWQQSCNKRKGKKEIGNTSTMEA